MIITFVTIVHIFVCLFIVGVVLLQQGKGADMGAAFGGGSQTLFGASGADNLLTRATTVCAAVFMVTSIMLAINSNKAIVEDTSLFKDAPEAPAETIPAGAPAPSGAPAEKAPIEPAASTAQPTPSTDGVPQAASNPQEAPPPATTAGSAGVEATGNPVNDVATSGGMAAEGQKK